MLGWNRLQLMTAVAVVTTHHNAQQVSNERADELFIGFILRRIIINSTTASISEARKVGTR